MTATAPPATDEGADLYRAILVDPADDAPRLVYADWLEEHGDGARAEFIRVQCELARLGPPPLVISEPCILTRQYGPDYYTLTGGEELEGGGRLIMEVKIGDRVDVPKRKGGKPLYGLRVHKIDPQGRDEIIVVRDAKSQPWPGKALRERERALFDQWAVPWFSLPQPWAKIVRLTPFDQDDREYPYGIVRRGFVSEVRLTAAAFMGAECEQCHGTGYEYHDNGGNVGQRNYCTGCNSTQRVSGGKGTGLTPGFAATLAGVAPVERVVLTGREPNDYGPPDDDCRFGWLSEHEHGDGSWALPRELLKCIEPSGQRYAGRSTFPAWPTRDAALSALSWAAAQYTRNKCGLPNMTKGKE